MLFWTNKLVFDSQHTLNLHLLLPQLGKCCQSQRVSGTALASVEGRVDIFAHATFAKTFEPGFLLAIILRANSRVNKGRLASSQQLSMLLPLLVQRIFFRQAFFEQKMLRFCAQLVMYYMLLLQKDSESVKNNYNVNIYSELIPFSSRTGSIILSFLLAPRFMKHNPLALCDAKEGPSIPFHIPPSLSPACK